jgi:hypothetical protein
MRAPGHPAPPSLTAGRRFFLVQPNTHLTQMGDGATPAAKKMHKPDSRREKSLFDQALVPMLAITYKAFPLP